MEKRKGQSRAIASALQTMARGEPRDIIHDLDEKKKTRPLPKKSETRHERRFHTVEDVYKRRCIPHGQRTHVRAWEGGHVVSVRNTRN